MKNILIFLFGAACGAAGSLFYLRKEVKKELAERDKKAEMAKNEEKEADLPFEMKEKEAEKVQAVDENADKVAINQPVAAREMTKIAYNNIVNQVKNGEKMRPGPGVPVMPRDEINDDMDANLAEQDDASDDHEPVKARADVFFEIDKDEFEFDKDYEKDRIVYFKGDRVMCTEAGKVIENPYLFVGNQWEDWVGDYAERTAFVRNVRLKTDYEVYVENGTYVDEYGYDSM